MNRRSFLSALPAIVVVIPALCKPRAAAAADVDREFLKGYKTINEIRAAEDLPAFKEIAGAVPAEGGFLVIPADCRPINVWFECDETIYSHRRLLSPNVV